MIFATTGTQLPFPRLIAALEALAPDLGEPIVAQIGPDPGAYPHLDTHASLDPAAFEAQFNAARVIVAHAGIGTILSAKKHTKPLILLPRRHDMGEYRNDHQLATAAQMEGHPGLYVAWQAEDLGPLLRLTTLAPAGEAPSPGLTRLTGFLRGWIAAG